MTAAAGSGDWKALAVANAIPLQTAYGWLRRGDATVSPRSGSQSAGVEPWHAERMLE